MIRIGDKVVLTKKSRDFYTPELIKNYYIVEDIYLSKLTLIYKIRGNRHRFPLHVLRTEIELLDDDEVTEEMEFPAQPLTTSFQEELTDALKRHGLR